MKQENECDEKERAYLRPLIDALFDTEYYDPKEKVDTLDFFVRPQASCFKYTRPIFGKTACETNLSQPCILEYPREFSITGFGLFVEHGTSKEDISEIVNNGIFEYHFSGCRPMFSQPLNTFPNFIERLVDDHSLSHSIGDNDFSTRCIVPFGTKKLLFKLKPGEAFRVQLKWSSPPKTSKAVKLTALIDGLHWRPS